MRQQAAVEGRAQTQRERICSALSVWCVCVCLCVSYCGSQSGTSDKHCDGQETSLNITNTRASQQCHVFRLTQASKSKSELPGSYQFLETIPATVVTRLALAEEMREAISLLPWHSGAVGWCCPPPHPPRYLSPGSTTPKEYQRSETLPSNLKVTVAHTLVGFWRTSDEKSTGPGGRKQPGELVVAGCPEYPSLLSHQAARLFSTC